MSKMTNVLADKNNVTNMVGRHTAEQENYVLDVLLDEAIVVGEVNVL